MVERTWQRAGEAGFSNVICQRRDVFRDGFGGSPESRDACLLFNILHCEEPVRILTEAARALHPTGVVHVIHWRADIETPPRPSMDIRPGSEQIIGWAGETGLLEFRGPALDLLPSHHGIRLERQGDL